MPHKVTKNSIFQEKTSAEGCVVRRKVTELTIGPQSTHKTKSEFMAIDLGLFCGTSICTDKQLNREELF